MRLLSRQNVAKLLNWAKQPGLGGLHNWALLLIAIVFTIAGVYLTQYAGYDYISSAAAATLISLATGILTLLVQAVVESSRLPRWAMLLLVGSFVAIGLVLLYRKPGPKQMTGEFRVAVMQFGVVDKDNQVHPLEDPRYKDLSTQLFQRLQTAYDHMEPAPGVRIQLWHDSLPFNEKSEELGFIRASTPVERATEVAELAKKIQAFMIIYGNVDMRQNPPEFKPEFYISESSLQRDLVSETDDVIGTQRLGVPISLSNTIFDPSINDELQTRVEAITFFILGLSYEIRPKPLPESALRYFNEAAKYWADNEGKEVLYHFIGREYHFSKKDDDALHAYATAVAIQPSYIRSYVSAGTVYYRQGQKDQPQRVSLLESAINQFKMALDHYKDDGPGSENSELSAHRLLGASYALEGDAYYRRGDYTTAGSLADNSIEHSLTALALGSEYRIGHDNIFEYHTALAYLGLGSAYELKGDVQRHNTKKDEAMMLYRKANWAYNLCVDHAHNRPNYQYLQELIGQNGPCELGAKLTKDYLGN
jgi:tetratricopeptide (TPR) repeat protein